MVVKPFSKPTNRACVKCQSELTSAGAVMSDGEFMQTSTYCTNSDCPNYGLYAVLSIPPTLPKPKETTNE